MISRTLAVALLAASQIMFAAVPQTSLTVSVKNQRGKPVDNAAVILDFLGSHQITKLGKRKATHWEARTNQEGVARFPPIPQGTLQLQVVGKDYQTYGKKVEVDEEKKILEVELNPPQKQYSAHDPMPEGPKP